MRHRNETARHRTPAEPRPGADPRPGTAPAAVAVVLALLSVGVVVSAVTSGDGSGTDGSDGTGLSREEREQQQALERDVAEQSRPTDEAVAATVRADLTAAVTAVAEKYDVQVGVSVRAAGGVVHAGELQDLRAWSSIKVPVAVAAEQKALQTGGGDDIAADVDAAITASDNDAALRLWDSLGDTDEDSARYVDVVLRQAGDPTKTVADRGRLDYEGFGDDRWTLDNQVIFADRLACLTGAGPVLDAMGRISDDHRHGAGELPGALFKGGWGADADGTYLLREFGLAGDEGARVPFAVAVTTADGSDATARDAVADLAQRLTPVLTGAADSAGTADAGGSGAAAHCQPR
ncbi:MAG TPA: hypothetical protein DIW82_07870 [Corynebacterium nuruki]|uniref:Serine hydrolase n=1 Tax=Corynebacterium nuruki TaxID=1032851 RepID=A0A3D4SZI0_9CORY|nr:hypothetical protein [Corynebacterium nuruki]